MINIGICDDDKIVTDILKNIIQGCMEELKEEVRITAFLSGEKLLPEVCKLDVLFLKIEIPGKDGIETGKKVKELRGNCKIIITTDTIERFKEALKIGAFWFVTKPFRKEEVKEALEAFLKNRSGMKKIEMYRERNLYTFFQKDIIYMKAVNSAVEFILKGGVYRKETSLSELERVLDNKLFYRINRQCIINLSKIEKYQTGKVFLNGVEIKVSIRRKKEFEKMYGIVGANN